MCIGINVLLFVGFSSFVGARQVSAHGAPSKLRNGSASHYYKIRVHWTRAFGIGAVVVVMMMILFLIFDGYDERYVGNYMLYVSCTVVCTLEAMAVESASDLIGNWILIELLQALRQPLAHCFPFQALF